MIRKIISSQIGLDPTEIRKALENNLYEAGVHRDIYEARQVGVKGVPFFLFNRKYAISGVQDSKVFLDVLERAFIEWRNEHP